MLFTDLADGACSFAMVGQGWMGVRECQKPGALRRELDCWVSKSSVQHRRPDLKHTMGAAG
jgi:hypothetical protein